MNNLPPSIRITVASRLLAGLLANSSVVAYNPNCGWCLVNAQDEDIARYAITLADRLIEADKVAEEEKEGKA